MTDVVVVSLGGKRFGDRYVSFWCPGCDQAHQIVVGDPARVWGWNGDLERPTFTPSVLTEGGPESARCHSFVTDGQIQFLGDCTHTLAGQTVPLPPWPHS